MKKLIPADYRSMPWKNGAGTTIEIAVFPEHAELGNFIWRVSRAQVVSDGNFSHFDGVDRSLALLKGAGMRVTANDVVTTVDNKNNIAFFSGDATTHAELIDGTISDFNLMSRRSACSHQLTHWKGGTTQQLPAETVFLYCANGSGKLIRENEVVNLSEDEALQLASGTNASEYTLQSVADSSFYCVQIKMNGNKL